MLKILLAPAEIKLSGGDGKPFCKDNFELVNLYEYRREIFENYQEFIANNNLEDLSNWFGIKRLDDVKKYSQSLKDKPTMKAINRYIGVAFEALDYNSLEQPEQKYIDENVIIFSNLFGVLNASDLIPDYKYKQGSQLQNINVEKFYKENLKDTLDEYLGDEVVDLRAGYYDKFYKPTASTITFKFLKDGKVVSHWAKHYRGLVVRAMAQNNIENFAELMNMPIDGLKLVEIQEKKNTKTLIMSIEG
ncbi:MAG: YaaA family protein [Arcobacteraceae bacterium]|nr:YaaA family protein [Arcobacteraceae bacterium]